MKGKGLNFIVGIQDNTKEGLDAIEKRMRQMNTTLNLGIDTKAIESAVKSLNSATDAITNAGKAAENAASGSANKTKMSIDSVVSKLIDLQKRIGNLQTKESLGLLNSESFKSGGITQQLERLRQMKHSLALAYKEGSEVDAASIKAMIANIDVLITRYQRSAQYIDNMTTKYRSMELSANAVTDKMNKKMLPQSAQDAVDAYAKTIERIKASVQSVSEGKGITITANEIREAEQKINSLLAASAREQRVLTEASNKRAAADKKNAADRARDQKKEEAELKRLEKAYLKVSNLANSLNFKRSMGTTGIDEAIKKAELLRDKIEAAFVDPKNRGVETSANLIQQAINLIQQEVKQQQVLKQQSDKQAIADAQRIQRLAQISALQSRIATMPQSQKTQDATNALTALYDKIKNGENMRSSAYRAAIASANALTAEARSAATATARDAKETERLETKLADVERIILKVSNMRVIDPNNKATLDAIVAKAETLRNALTQAMQNPNASTKSGISNNYIKKTIAEINLMTAAFREAEMASQRVTNEEKRAKAEAERHRKEVNSLKSDYGDLGNIIRNALSVYAAKQFVSSILEVGGEFEKQRIALKAILGDMGRANAMFSQLKGLSIESPFTFLDLTSYAKQLSAFSIPYNELYETTKRLADVSAGLGVDMNRIILAYGQVRSAAFLRGQEVRQFTEAGIPLLDKLAERFTNLEGRVVSVGEVFDKISKREVSFQMVKDVLWEMTDEGGQFYNMQEQLVESLAGRIQKIKDMYQILLSDLAKEHDGVIDRAFSIAEYILKNWKTFKSLIYSVTAAFLAAKVAAIGYGVYLSLTANVTKLAATQFGLMSKTIIGTARNAVILRNVLKTTFTTAAGLIGVAVTALAGVAAWLWTSKDAADEFAASTNQAYQEAVSSIASQIFAMNELKEKLKDIVEGSENYKDIIRELDSKYGKFIDGNFELADSYSVVAQKCNEAADAMRRIAMEQGYESSVAKAQEQYNTDIANIQDALAKDLQRWYLEKGAIDKPGANKIAAIMVRSLVEGKTINDIAKYVNKEFPAAGINENLARYILEKVIPSIEEAKSTLSTNIDVAAALFGDQETSDEQVKAANESAAKILKSYKDTFENGIKDKGLTAPFKEFYAKLNEEQKSAFDKLADDSQRKAFIENAIYAPLIENINKSNVRNEIKKAINNNANILSDWWTVITEEKLASSQDAVAGAFYKTIEGLGKAYWTKEAETADVKKKYEKGGIINDEVKKQYESDLAYMEHIKNAFIKLGLDINDWKDSKKGRSREDTLAKEIQYTIKQYKEAYETFKKYRDLYGQADANVMTQKEAADAYPLLADETNFEKMPELLNKYLNSLTLVTDKQKEAAREGRHVTKEWGLEILAEAVNAANEEVERYINSLEALSKIYNATGNLEGAKMVAGANFNFIDTDVDALYDKYSILFEKFGKKKKELLSLSKTDAQNLLGKSSNAYKAWLELKNRIEKSGLDIKVEIADAMTSVASNKTKRATLADERDKKLASLSAAGFAAGTPAYEAMRQVYDDQISSLLLEYLKTEQNIDNIIGNIDKYTKKELKAIKDSLDSLSNDEDFKNLNATDQAAIISAKTQIGSYLSGKGLLGISEARKNFNTAQSDVDKATNAYNDAIAKGKEVDIKAAKERLDAARKEAEERRSILRNSENDAVNQITSISNAITKLGTASELSLSDIGNLAGEIINAFSDAGSKIGGIVGAIFSLVDMIATEGLEGFVGNVMNLVANLFDGIFGTDWGNAKSIKKYQEEKAKIDALFDLWDDRISRSLSNAEKVSISQSKVEIETAKQLASNKAAAARGGISKYLNAGASAGSRSYGYRIAKNLNKNLTGQERKTIEKIVGKEGLENLTSGRAYNLSTLTASQLKELTQIEGFWTNIDEDVRNYINAIIESSEAMEDYDKKLQEITTQTSIDNISDALSDALDTSNGFDDWDSQFKSMLRKALIHATVYGEAIQSKLSEFMDVYEDYMSDGEISDAEQADLHNRWEGLHKEATARKEALEKAGLYDDEDTGGLTNAIQNVTEETADLLASYINAIRGDVSVKRSLVERLVNELIPTNNAIAESQLQQLNLIATHTQIISDNTNRIVEYGESMATFWDRVRNGTYKLTVS